MLGTIAPLVLGLVIAALAAGLYFMSQRAQGLKSLLQEAGTHLEGFAASNAALAEKLQASEKHLQEQLRTGAELGEKVKQIDLTAVKTSADYQVKLTELEASVETLLLKLDHYTEQTLSLTAQLKELDQHNKELLQAQAQYEKLKKITATLNPETFTASRRRAAQFETLYKNMRGLKEMAEERNKNWEVALRKLSTWVVEESRGENAARNKNFNPLLSEALEIVGAHLVEDDFSGSFAGEHVTDPTAPSQA